MAQCRVSRIRSARSLVSREEEGGGNASGFAFPLSRFGDIEGDEWVQSAGMIGSRRIW